MNPFVQKHRRPFVAGLLAFVLVVIGYAVWTHFHQGHGHTPGHDDHGAAVLSLNDGQRWATDEPLRLGMQRIRDAVAPVLVAHNRRNLTREQAKALADSVQENVTYLIQNCKLVPKADATLHALIAGLIEGAALVAADPRSDDGVAKLAQALRGYPNYFDHPGWSPLMGVEP